MAWPSPAVAHRTKYGAHGSSSVGASAVNAAAAATLRLS
jgi:hypothetical protein